MINADESYENIYQEVLQNLNMKENFSCEELFSHCMETCRKIFYVAEYRFGKKTANIPNDLVEKIGALYDKK